MQSHETTLTANRTWTKALGLLASIALGLAIISLGWPQAVTGVLINALLLLTAEWVGLPQAIILGMLTPLGGALPGVLPMPMVVMIPFIALGNSVLVSVYAALRGRNKGTPGRALALIAGAAAKFALLYAAVTLLLAAPLTLTMGTNANAVVIPNALAQMMRWPQLATALSGGLLAQGVVGAYGWLGRHKV